MNILFFDVVPTNIVRFFTGIISELRSGGDNKFYFLIEEDDSNTIDYVKKHYKFYSKAEYVGSRNVDWFVSYLESNNIEAVFVNAQRIPDDMVVFSAKKLSVPTFMFQHGMYIEFLKRNAGFYFSKLYKTIRFFIYALNLGKALPCNRCLLVWKYIQCFVLGKNQVDIGIPRDLLNVDRVYVYGDFWKEFHKKQFGYNFVQQLVVGYPDLQDLKEIELKERHKNSLCYVAQTLVEDGRIDRELQLRFYRMLVDLCKKTEKNLIVKLHPRSDLTLFKYNPEDRVQFRDADLPFCGKYIGHYSTLIAKGFLLSGDLCIWEYTKHPTPFYFSKMASIICSSEVRLEEWLLSSKKNAMTTQGYFDYNPNVFGSVVSDFYRVIDANRDGC